MVAKFTLSLLSAAFVCANSVAAQDDVTFSLRNSIGLVTYCAENGFIDPEVANVSIDRMRNEIEATSVGAPDADVDAEVAGKLGSWGRSALPIADRAQLFDQSVEAFCEELVVGL